MIVLNVLIFGMKTIVFTDLDGTFLNHDNYSYQESEEALSVLSKKEIPLVFTTSKTKDEVEILQNKIGIKEPFIVENGAALFIPKNYQGLDFSFLNQREEYFIFRLGVSYIEVVEFYNSFKEEFGMFGFSDMTIAEVVKYTGLLEDEAKISIKRGFTEPFLLEDELMLKDLQTKAAQNGLKITKGGRFYHLIGENQDKGKAVEVCVQMFEDIFSQKIKSIGLGDGQNDVPLLESVDVPIAIQNHEGAYVDISSKKVQRSSYKGAKGWNEMILKNV